jgi:hypothetical protein
MPGFFPADRGSGKLAIQIAGCMIKFMVMFLLQIAPPIYSNLKKSYHNIT